MAEADGPGRLPSRRSSQAKEDRVQARSMMTLTIMIARPKSDLLHVKNVMTDQISPQQRTTKLTTKLTTRVPLPGEKPPPNFVVNFIDGMTDNGEEVYDKARDKGSIVSPRLPLSPPPLLSQAFWGRLPD